MKFLNDIFTKRADPQTVMMLHYTVVTLTWSSLNLSCLHACTSSQVTFNCSISPYAYCDWETATAAQANNAILQDHSSSKNPSVSGKFLWMMQCWLLKYIITPHNRSKCLLLFFSTIRPSFQLKQMVTIQPHTQNSCYTLLWKSSHSASQHISCLLENMKVQYNVHKRLLLNQ